MNVSSSCGDASARVDRVIRAIGITSNPEWSWFDSRTLIASRRTLTGCGFSPVFSSSKTWLSTRNRTPSARPASAAFGRPGARTGTAR